MNDIELNKKLINLMESAMVEKAKPDFPDIDGDGDKKEPMKKALKDKEKKKEQLEGIVHLTVQQRVMQQSRETCVSINDWLEQFIINPKKFDAKAFNIVKHFKERNVTQAHARKILGLYTPVKEEYTKLQNMPTPAQIEKTKRG